MLFFKKLKHDGTSQRTIDSPVFMKEVEDENALLNRMNKILGNIEISSPSYEILERDIRYLKYGIVGEKNVEYELKNSFLPFICLHDIRIEHNEHVAQFDFVIITKALICVLETKRLNGDIEITSDGDFVRYLKSHTGKVYKKEGMYSPVVQNQRHVNILRDFLKSFGMSGNMEIYSRIVMANPRSIINKRFATKDIKEQIVKYDQIGAELKKLIDKTPVPSRSKDEDAYSIAKLLIEKNAPIEINLEAKYSAHTACSVKKDEHVTSKKSERSPEAKSTLKISDSDKENHSLHELLKKYRAEYAKREGLKPY